MNMFDNALGGGEKIEQEIKQSDGLYSTFHEGFVAKTGNATFVGINDPIVYMQCGHLMPGGT